MSWLLAHGVGSRGDLPLPLWLFAWAAAFALAISFVALGVLWRRPLLADAAEGRSVVGSGFERVVRPIAQTVTFALFVLVILAGLFGADSVATNITPVTIYVVFWVGMTLVSAVFGDVWRAISPFETIAAAMDRARPDRSLAAAPISHWPATAALFAFLFLELVHPSGSSPRILAVGLLIYTAAMVVGVARFGRGWLDAAEGFGVLFGLLAAMAPIHRTDDGRLALRAPLSGLATLVPRPGTAALILVVLGGTTFDGFSESELWRDVVGRQTGWTDAGYRFVGLVLTIAAVALLYAVAVKAIAATTGIDWRRAGDMFAPSLVPIVFGYAIAHYAQLLIDETQSFVFRLSDPFGQDWNLFGTADNSINFDIVSVDLIAWIQALAIVIGHVAGVLVAHDRAISEFESREAIRSQYAMLFIMVLYSIAGLWLLLNA